MKTAVIFWSGTGNTEIMAQAVAEGAGAELFSVSDFKGNIGDYGARKSACGIVVIFNKRLAVTNRSFVKAYKFIKSA